MAVHISRTKIVCTLGPSLDDPRVLESFIRAGVNVARVNTAHGTPEKHARRVSQVRKVARSLGHPVGILVDVPGPKLRLGPVPQGALVLRQGTEIVLETGSGSSDSIPVRYPLLEKEVRRGEPLYLADGTVKLVAIQIKGRRIRCRVALGGVVRSGSGINLPDTDLAVKLPTKDDAVWIEFARTHQAEWIGVSFVRTVEDIVRVRQRLGASRTAPMLMAKIEKRQALDHLEGIVDAADGVMVARGDLGVETPLAEVPIVQKRIIAAANERGKPVVTATQMLESMVEHPSPTRAEVTDAANAILDGSDALMLSAETAIGRYPVEAVQTLRSVITATEASYPFGAFLERSSRTSWSSVSDAVSLVACRLSYDVRAKAIVVPLDHVATAFRIARFRPQAPIIALSTSMRLAYQLTVAWDVYPVFVPHSSHHALEAARRWLFQRRMARAGDLVIVVSAVSKGRGHVRDALQVAQL